MSSFDVKLADQNRDKIEMVIDGFINNGRTIASLILKVSEMAIENDKNDSSGILLSEDEKNCKEREEFEIQEIAKSKNLSKGGIADMKNSKKYRKLRFVEMIPKVNSFLRMSHNLDYGGYNWDLFFTDPNDEPEFEATIRDSLSDDDRTKYRHKSISDFIRYSYPHWKDIHEKKLIFLVNHFSTLFPNNEFTDKLGIIFGGQNNHLKYINEQDLERTWRLIHACIKNAIKYMYLIGKIEFHKDDIVFKIDITSEIKIWNVDVLTIRPVPK